MILIEKAIENSKRPTSYWHHRSADKKFIRGSAAQRLEQNTFLSVDSKPKFTIDRNQKIFTIGSCFARNIERKLLLNGISVPSTQIDIDEKYFRIPGAKNTDILNKFNTHSIYNEIYRSIEKKKYPDDGFIHTSNNLWYDPQTSYTKAHPKAVCMKIRKKIQSVYKRAKECDVIIVTLGLTETWVDQHTGIYLNSLPPIEVNSEHPGRFKFFNAGLTQTIEALEKTFTLLKENSKKTTRIILTVSPVPLQRTFTDHDVITANTFSKSVLRIAAQMLMEKYDYVDYYPAYEMINCSPRELAWEEDCLHVKDNMVEFVTNIFLERYIS
jgi:hypothetical protein